MENKTPFEEMMALHRRLNSENNNKTTLERDIHKLINLSNDIAKLYNFNNDPEAVKIIEDISNLILDLQDLSEKIK